jgi:hypothetical protein
VRTGRHLEWVPVTKERAMRVGEEINVNMELWHSHTDREQYGRNIGTIILSGDKRAESLAQSYLVGTRGQNHWHNHT